MTIYFGRDRTVTYTIGCRLGGGGEGEVYEISGRRDLVAKIYYDSRFSSSDASDPRQERREKIETMLDQPVDPYINGVLTVAWPQDILTDPWGKFVGYTMPRVSSRYHIFAASRERERLQLFPGYTWKTAVLIAYNLALAVKTIHQTNAVVGDMNPNNIMLDEKGHVTLIDTDSFNITNNVTGKTYKCTVGVPEMLPPELQGKNLELESSVFTKRTDSFALSIHIFNLLMNNCHPFGSVGGHEALPSAVTNPVVYNIEKGNCPYVTGGKDIPSPDAPNIRMMPKEVRQLFDRAFQYTPRTAREASTVSGRPEAGEWQKVLGALYRSQMTECRRARPLIHIYPSGYPRCPWCEIRQVTGPRAKKPAAKAARTYSAVPRFTGAEPQRSPWPLWIFCILMGVLYGPVLAHFLDPICRGGFDHFLSYESLCILMAALSGICGAVLARNAQEAYQEAPHPWPWIFLGLLVPFVTTLVVVAIMILVFLFFLIFSFLLAVIRGLVYAAGMVAGLFTG